jgi:hypothetical protein
VRCAARSAKLRAHLAPANWPQPEVPQNVDKTFGNLDVTEEETQIVVFPQTLTDGCTRLGPDNNTLYGYLQIAARGYLPR